LTLLADPGVEIPEEAAAIHGITTEKARGEGRPVYDVLVAVLERLTVHLRAGLPLVIFNARYDLTVLDREARRNGVVPLTERGFDLRVVDPLVLDKWLHRYRKGSRKLDAQAEHYKARLDQAHDAAADAVAAARVAWCIGKRGQVIRRVRNGGDAIELKRLQAEWEQVRDDLDRLHAAQQVWARAERARFAEYKRSIGEPEVAVRVEAEDWPLTPFVAPEHGRLVDVEPVVPRPGNAIAA
jgi:DNA polymerase III epsilon subunit-like protein